MGNPLSFAQMPRLLMFDIDGTLTATNGVDTECYVQAMSEYLGEAIDSDWSQYQHVTDSGIAGELFKLHGRPMEEVRLVQRRFFELIEQALRRRPESCVPITGAAEFLQHVQRSADWVAGFATGGWSESARAKLRQAGIDFQGLPFASADDAEARIDIMKICLELAEAECRGGLTGVVYVGDAAWDARAAKELGWPFIGIGRTIRSIRERAGDTYPVFNDFSDIQSVLAAASAL